MRRRLAVVMVLAVAAAACGGDSPSEQVDTYVKAANAAQAPAERPFNEANRLYAQFQSGKLDDPADVRRLAAAETAIRRTQARLARIPAPAPARSLRARLLRLYELNADLAHETVLLAQYLPAREKTLLTVARANQRLIRDLRRAKEPPAQAAALTDYRRRLATALRTLRALDAPPVARSLDRAQLKRLAASRKLAGQLRSAVRARDARRTARLVVAFREVGNLGSAERALQARDLEAYAARRRAIRTALAEVQRERNRLKRAQ